MPNLLAIFVIALFPMIVGFIWYHPKLMGEAWKRETGLTDEKLKSGNMLLIFGISLFCSFLMSFFITSIATHDVYVKGATYYIEKSGTETEKQEAKAWQEAYDRMVVKRPEYSTSRWTHGFAHAFVVLGIFFVLPLVITNGLFERKSWKYILINGGYWIITVGLMGIAHSIWK